MNKKELSERDICTKFIPHSKPPLRLVSIVRPATQLEIVGGRKPAIRKRHNVVILEEPAFGAAALSPNERASTLVPPPHFALH